jgi:alpha-glucosidase
MKIITLYSLLMLLSFTVCAQSLSRSIGNMKTMKKSAQGITIQTDFGNLKATVYSPNVVKINITRNSVFTDFSYAVNVSPTEAVKFTVTEYKNKITLATDSLTLSISKQPVRVALYNKAGQLINSDDKDFGTSWIDDEITTYKKLLPNEKFIGLGEKTGSLNRRGSGYSHWNADVPGYILSADPLYSTIPFYIGIHDSLVYGVFLDNSSKTHFNFGASQERFSSFATENGDMNYFLIYHSSIASIISSYTWLTGRMPMPPLWSLGFQQCRWSYYPQSEVLTLAQTFRDKNIPCDVIWFDIHYMERYKVFTWDTDRFPDPKGMLTKMDQLGFKNVVIIDPGIKVEKDYPAYEDGLQKNHFIKYPDGTVYSGQVWPGWCTFTDYTSPQARIWWGDLFKEHVDEGIDGFWCDMNEFATWGQKAPNNLQFAGDGYPITHKMAHNIYGLQMARATYDGAKKLLNGRRPFVLTRAGYSGLQRYTAIWTGDNVGSDDHMLLAVRMVSSLGVSGVAFAGADVSGFVTDATPELYARWMSMAAFSPFYRSHKAYGLRDSEPWSYGEDIEHIVSKYVQLRYRMLPYLYSSFYTATQTGMPVQRTLAIDYPMDEKIYYGEYENEFMSGPALLVAACRSTARATNVYLPKGNWYDFNTDKKYAGNTQFYSDAALDKLPVFVKEGSFIPMQSLIQTTVQKPTDTLVLHVYYSSIDNQFTYYEDAGDRYDYQSGGYYKRMMSIRPGSKQIILDKTEGSYASHFRHIKMVLHGFDPLMNEVTVNGSSTKIAMQNIELMQQMKLPVVHLQNRNEQITIGW